ncbi:MAG TPA: N-acetyl-gamma-glutamyl-phosphate reductase [Candidatus Limnocylindrales bacterium]|nr:N-acetyl-gamma-glutamyl-phosphate reductase [Candidatus Limnocylindrales bacterium]
MDLVRAAVVGASGYIGGELLRLLIGHPRVRVVAATSTRQASRRLDSAHPNLRGLTELSFIRPEALDEYDVIFVAMPHGEAMAQVPALLPRAKCLIDLSADFRLSDPDTYRRYYGLEHRARELLGGFTPGWPERYREALRGADRISVPGCTALAAILALYPLAAEDLIEPDVTVDARSGSSGSGAGAGDMNLHAERSGAMRVFAPLAHRHESEIGQATGLNVRMSATGVEAVRGVQVLCRGRAKEALDDLQLRKVYRRHYRDEPFVRVVAYAGGGYRLPEPKILSGSNFCDVGFAADPASGAVVAIAALDNLMKGGAGNAVQCLNIRMGWPETLGLEFPGLHPI